MSWDNYEVARSGTDTLPRPNLHLTAEQADAYQALVTAARDVVWNPIGSRPEEERERRLRAKALREALEAVEALDR